MKLPSVSRWLILLTVGTIFTAGWVWYSTTEQLEQINYQTETALLPVAPVPVLQKSNLIPQGLSAQAVYVLDVDSGSRLFAKNEQELRAPASTVKLVTALVARQVYAQQETLVVGQERFTEGNTVDFYEGQQVSVTDLLHALLISSGNDAAEILAFHHPQGRDGFIADMNALVAQLGIEQSSFTNPSGLDGPGQYMSAHDLAIILAQAMRDPILEPILTADAYQIQNQEGRVQQYLWTTNTLLASGEVIGGKTGTTEWAGEVLAAYAQVNGHPVVTIVMGSTDRYQDTRSLLDWVEAAFEWVEPDQLGLDPRV